MFTYEIVNAVKSIIPTLMSTELVNLQEPVAFLGGIFAGILRLDLEEEPLKEWVTRTVEAAGIKEDEIDTQGSTSEAAPQQIEIE